MKYLRSIAFQRAAEGSLQKSHLSEWVKARRIDIRVGDRDNSGCIGDCRLIRTDHEVVTKDHGRHCTTIAQNCPRFNPSSDNSEIPQTVRKRHQPSGVKCSCRGLMGLVVVVNDEHRSARRFPVEDKRVD